MEIKSATRTERCLVEFIPTRFYSPSAVTGTVCSKCAICRFALAARIVVLPLSDRACHAKDVLRRYIEMRECLPCHLNRSLKFRGSRILNAECVQRPNSVGVLGPRHHREIVATPARCCEDTANVRKRWDRDQ